MYPNSHHFWWRLLLCIVLVSPLALPSHAAPEAATLHVSGLGLLKNRELRQSLILLLGEQRSATLDANALEDAAVMLLSTLVNEGYQKPTVEIEATLEDGTITRLLLDTGMENSLPRPLTARSVRFHIKTGLRWHIQAVSITGLTVLPHKRASAFFRTKSMLFVLAKTNAYTPSRVARAASALQDELRQRGYAEATVKAALSKVDETNGEVRLSVEVNEGLFSQLSAVHSKSPLAENLAVPSPDRWLGRAWTPSLMKDIKEAYRGAYYKIGYPDVALRLSTEASAPENGKKGITITVDVIPGRQVKVGRLRFVGNLRTHEAVLQRSAQVRPANLLDPLALAESRYRISRLGVFDSVELSYAPPMGEVRDPVFTLQESQRHVANLLLGYGSYEQVRGGIEFRQLNLFGLAHQSRLQVVQSMKSSSGDYTYSIPQFFGGSVDASTSVFALQRQELAFLRQELGASFTLKRPVPWLRAEGTASYTFQALRNRDNELATQITDKAQLNVSSVALSLTSDHRDNPLRPRRGYRWFTQAELAARSLGGTAEYQRLELGFSYHTGWGEGRWVHLGATHGLITTLGTTDLTLPVNKRFFPGGDNSLRGYQKGEAAPRDAEGLFVGAKAYLLLNLELEQALTKNWSVVVFTDALGTALRLRDYPFTEKLYTVGLGVRYQTLIGPVRVEYGHNLNPRPADPHGTWQISIGYPF